MSTIPCNKCGRIHTKKENPYKKLMFSDYGIEMPYSHRNMHRDQVHVDCSKCGKTLFASLVAKYADCDSNGVVFYYCKKCA
jgi:hypothetical protein